MAAKAPLDSMSQNDKLPIQTVRRTRSTTPRGITAHAVKNCAYVSKICTPKTVSRILEIQMKLSITNTLDAQNERANSIKLTGLSSQ